MNNTMRQLEIELQKAVIFELVIGAIATVVFFWLLYLVIKAGVRDGIRAAKESERPWYRPSRPASTDLPDMRAD